MNEDHTLEALIPVEVVPATTVPRYRQHEWEDLPEDQKQRWLTMTYQIVTAPVLDENGEETMPGMLKVTWYDGDERFIAAAGETPTEAVVKATAAQEWDEKTGSWPADFPRVGMANVQEGCFCTGIDFAKMKAQWTRPVAPGVMSARWEPILGA